MTGLLAVASGATACDIVERAPNPVNGKQLFVERCAACHSLERAGSQGTIGPDLDAAFGRALADGLKRSTVKGVVEGQILHPRRGSRMPAELVTGQDAKDVAAYVAQAAAAPGSDTGQLAEVGAGKAGGPPGRRVFNGAGCGACHVLSDAGAAGTAGPDLDRSLANRSRAFIRESIVEPDAAIARGYSAGVMPTDFRSQLARRELAALVAYLARVTR